MPLGLQANASDSCLHFLPSSTNLPGMRKCSQSKGRAPAEFTRELSSQTKRKNERKKSDESNQLRHPTNPSYMRLEKSRFHPHPGNPKSIPGGRDE